MCIRDSLYSMKQPQRISKWTAWPKCSREILAKGISRNRLADQSHHPLTLRIHESCAWGFDSSSALASPCFVFASPCFAFPPTFKPKGPGSVRGFALLHPACRARVDRLSLSLSLLRRVSSRDSPRIAGGGADFGAEGGAGLCLGPLL